MPAGSLVELGQLGGESGQPRGEIVRPQSGLPHRVESIARGEERLTRPLHRGGEPGELRLGRPQQRTEPGGEPVELALDAYELILGGGQLGPGTGGDRGFEIIPVEIVRVDGRDVGVTGLVDAPPESGEAVDGLPRGRRTVHGRDGLDGDLQIALSGVELVEGLRGGILRRLGLGPLPLPAPAEPTPRTAPGDGGRQRRDEQRHGQQHQQESIANAPTEAVPTEADGAVPTDRNIAVPADRDITDGGTPTRSRLRLRVCRRHIPLPCCFALPGTFSHQVRTNTRAR